MDAEEEGERERREVVEVGERAWSSLNRVLTFLGGWMVPQESLELVEKYSKELMSSAAGKQDSMDIDGGGEGQEQADRKEALWEEEEEDSGPPAWVERRRAERIALDESVREVARERLQREAQERRKVAGEDVDMERREAATQRGDMLEVRVRCLPEVMFMEHQVLHETGEFLLRLERRLGGVSRVSNMALSSGSAGASESYLSSSTAWFEHAQDLVSVVASDDSILSALGQGHIEDLLRCMQRSSIMLVKLQEPSEED